MVLDAFVACDQISIPIDLESRGQKSRQDLVFEFCIISAQLYLPFDLTHGTSHMILLSMNRRGFLLIFGSKVTGQDQTWKF